MEGRGEFPARDQSRFRIALSRLMIHSQGSQVAFFLMLV